MSFHFTKVSFLFTKICCNFFSVIEPKDRIGAKDKTYYTSIRGHEFFQGLDFEKLHTSIPTYLETFVKDGDAPGTPQCKNLTIFMSFRFTTENNNSEMSLIWQFLRV